jgi:hypothetical protein
MSLTDIGTLIVGAASIYVGCTQKTFYSGGPHATASKQRIPTWLGRLLFVGVGSLFLRVELKRLFLDSR